MYLQNRKKGPITCGVNIWTNRQSVQCCQRSTDNKIEITTCTDCNNTNPPSNCGPPYTVRGESGNSTVGGPVEQTPPPAAVQTCPDGSALDANGNCPTSSSPSSNQALPLPPPSTTTSSDHHHKRSDLGNLGGGEGGSMSTKRGGSNNSPTPPACPDKGPIPPNCTMKPTF